MARVNALMGCIVRVNGMPVSVLEGQVFDSGDDVVRQFPWIFYDDDVEEATARPGQKRTTRTKP